jgi:hypothetical protein
MEQRRSSPIFEKKNQLYLGWKSSVFNEVSSRIVENFPFWQKNRDGCPSEPDETFMMITGFCRILSHHPVSSWG